MYRNPALTVDALCSRWLKNEIEVLLIKRGRDPYNGSWAFPGGFVDYGEDPEEAVKRELEEETHIKTVPDSKPALVAVLGNPTRDPRQHTVTIAYALKIDFESLAGMKGDDDAAEAQWHLLDPVCDDPSFPLAFDHRELAKSFRVWLKGDNDNNYGYILEYG